VVGVAEPGRSGKGALVVLPVEVRQCCWMRAGVGEPSRHNHDDQKDQPK
jgi:hypothetical protein